MSYIDKILEKYKMIHFNFTFLQDEGKYFCVFSNLAGINIFRRLSKKKYNKIIKQLESIDL